MRMADGSSLCLDSRTSGCDHAADWYKQVRVGCISGYTYTYLPKFPLEAHFTDCGAMANAMHFLKPSGSGSTSASPMGGMPFANVLRSRRKQSAEPKAMADAAQEVSFLRNNAQAARGNDMGPPPAFVGAAGTTLMHTISTSSSRGGTVTDSIVELDTVTKVRMTHDQHSIVALR